MIVRYIYVDGCIAGAIIIVDGKIISVIAP